ncbi:glucose uptake inhibitor SgrT [Klebsiella sp. BIGb0407]|uniref:glucose uptake inhibitor SgrT n=1 Tax=Klebsiella sp. BIGb0407 TaxID=2940603 RepID=UPI002169E3FA|nr:glucose uptake inhibitor SgrT [Klebsiella sp. BIGb0407]MCS3433060.1 hypothetical protein [Klebsiella sp. BIGb0407]
MKRLSTIQFYQQYFAATDKVGSEGLARLTVAQKLAMLEDLMQWEGNSKTSDSNDLPTQV